MNSPHLFPAKMGEATSQALSQVLLILGGPWDSPLEETCSPALTPKLLQGPVLGGVPPSAKSPCFRPWTEDTSMHHFDSDVDGAAGNSPSAASRPSSPSLHPASRLLTLLRPGRRALSAPPSPWLFPLPGLLFPPRDSTPHCIQSVLCEALTAPYLLL